MIKKQSTKKKQNRQKQRKQYNNTLTHPTAKFVMNRMPDIFNVTFYYDAQYSGNSTLVTQLNKAVRLNSCYDPDLSGVGTQPVGWDQWSQFYATYRVISTRVQVRIENQDADEGYIAVVWNSDSASAYTGTLQTAQSVPGAKWCDVTALVAGKPIAYIDSTYSIKKAYSFNTSLSGTSPELLYKTLTPISTNPAYAANLYIGLFRPDSSTGNVSYRFNVRMWINTELSSRNLLGPS